MPFQEDLSCNARVSALHKDRRPVRLLANDSTLRGTDVADALTAQDADNPDGNNGDSVDHSNQAVFSPSSRGRQGKAPRRYGEYFK